MKWVDEGHRVVAISGSVQIGAVFTPEGGGPLSWRMWFGVRYPKEGQCSTVLAGKNRVLAAFADMLARADLQEGAA